MKSKRPNGFILWSGPSEIDGAPIVVVATGVRDGGSNPKTGPMTQVYIIRSDISPFDASRCGQDRSICGDCRHRGRITIIDGQIRLVERTCYVNVLHGPRMVYDALQRGLYAEVDPDTAQALLARRNVRFGSYGDPGAVPKFVWDRALESIQASNAYTHLWRTRPDLARFCMASCDTPEERTEAKALGFRTYRVRGDGSPLLAGEGACPASDEMVSDKNPDMQCARCMLCDGTKRGIKADISILVHGTGRGHFNRLSTGP